MELKIKPLSPKIGTDIPLPRFATAGAACMDLCACVDEAVTLNAGERRLVPTGIANRHTQLKIDEMYWQLYWQTDDNFVIHQE